jgi:GntR family carbon starvation induced transcriptional regulator
MTSPKPTQADTVCQRIRSEILQGALLPGEKLNIKALEQRFEVSLGAIREALSRLGAEGLVVAEAHRGYHVTPVSRDELMDLTHTRIEIEGLCLRRAIAQGDVEWESRIVAAAHRMERLQEHASDKEARRTPAWNQAHGDFHAALVDACHSPWLLRMRDMLYAQSERYRLMSVPLDTDQRDVKGEHRRLMDAVLRRDAEQAAQVVREHFMATVDIILRSPQLK